MRSFYEKCLALQKISFSLTSSMSVFLYLLLYFPASILLKMLNIMEKRKHRQTYEYIQINRQRCIIFYFYLALNSEITFFIKLLNIKNTNSVLNLFVYFLQISLKNVVLFFLSFPLVSSGEE